MVDQIGVVDQMIDQMVVNQMVVNQMVVNHQTIDQMVKQMVDQMACAVCDPSAPMNQEWEQQALFPSSVTMGTLISIFLCPWIKAEIHQTAAVQSYRASLPLSPGHPGQLEHSTVR